MPDLQIYFARINRRAREGEPFNELNFAKDMSRLIDSRRTTSVERNTAQKAGKRWFAGDFAVTPDGSFATGLLGYSERRTDIEFDDESWSWQKGEGEERETGSGDTVVPFAVDMDPGGRWVAFSTAPRLTRYQFRAGLEKCLQQAALDLEVLGADWEVDLITSEETVREWLRLHPQVFKLKRTVKFTNPGKEIDDDRAEMRALGARRKTEEFAARRGETLAVGTDQFERQIEGVGEGFLEIQMESRLATGAGSARFRSTRAPDTVTTDASPTTEGRTAAVLSELSDYARQRRPSTESDDPS